MDRQQLGYNLMHYPSYLWHFLLQTSISVYNFYSGANFCGKKFCGNFIYGIFSFKPVFLYIISTVEQIFAETNFAVILFCGNLFLRIAKQKNAKIRNRNNLVPHGTLFSLGTLCQQPSHPVLWNTVQT